VRVHSPTSRSGSRIYLSIWDLFWALVSPIAALYLRDVDIQSNADWSVIASYWVLSAGFAILAFFAFRLQDGMTRYFSVHEALDIAEAVLFAELMTFAVLFDELRQAATYVDRILRGAKPADLPAQAPTKYETVVNGWRSAYMWSWRSCGWFPTAASKPSLRTNRAALRKIYIGRQED
jgi:cytochrome c oxidase subunit IV